VAHQQTGDCKRPSVDARPREGGVMNATEVLWIKDGEGN
jgi:hypothetical protein